MDALVGEGHRQEGGGEIVLKDGELLRVLGPVEDPERALIGGDRIGDAGAAGASKALHHDAEIHLGLGELLRRSRLGKRRDRGLVGGAGLFEIVGSFIGDGLERGCPPRRDPRLEEALSFGANGQSLVVKLDRSVELLGSLRALLESDGDLHQHFGALDRRRGLVIGHRQRCTHFLGHAICHHATSQSPP